MLNGGLVTLRPVTLADVPLLHAALADVELSVLAGAIRTRAEGEQQRWTVAELEEIYARWGAAHDRIVWVIVDNSSGHVVGESVLNRLDLHNRSCEFRIWMSEVRDKGLGTEATRLTMSHAFDDQGLNRVELEVYDFNPRARHVYDKIGFVHEGRRRQALLFEGQWVDAHVMAILASDWYENSDQTYLRPQ